MEEQSEQLPERLEIEEGLARAKYLFRAESEKELSFKKVVLLFCQSRLDLNASHSRFHRTYGIPVSVHAIIFQIDLSPIAASVF